MAKVLRESLSTRASSSSVAWHIRRLKGLTGKRWGPLMYQDGQALHALSPAYAPVEYPPARETSRCAPGAFSLLRRFSEVKVMRNLQTWIYNIIIAKNQHAKINTFFYCSYLFHIWLLEPGCTVELWDEGYVTKAIRSYAITAQVKMTTQKKSFVPWKPF